jgi:hypothetical protein
MNRKSNQGSLEVVGSELFHEREGMVVLVVAKQHAASGVCFGDKRGDEELVERVLVDKLGIPHYDQIHWQGVALVEPRIIREYSMLWMLQ